MPRNKAGLALTSEVRLSIDWSSLTTNVASAAVNGFKAFLGSSEAAASGLGNILTAAKSIKKDVPLGTRATELIILSFAWAFDELRSKEHLDAVQAKALATDAISKLKREIETHELTIPHDFFENPTSAVPYTILRDEFLAGRRAFRPSSEATVTLRHRFDSAFRSAVWSLLLARTDVFAELEAILSSSASRTADLEMQWTAYRESLVYAFNVAPVFGQEETKIALAQLYVPLRCFWAENKANPLTQSKYEKDVLVQTIKHVRSLDDELKEWVNNDDPNDWLRLIGGGPGSGKSTSAKAFAASIATLPEFKPLYVSLAHLKVDGKLRDDLNDYFTRRSGSPFSVGPLEKKAIEEGPKVVLVLDGLDEIARPGDRADDIARDVMDWVGELRNELVGDTRASHKVLVTGRMPSFQAARKRMNRTGREALEVLSLMPLERVVTTKDEERVSEVNNWEGLDKLLTADDRTKWWGKYSTALGRPKGRPPGLDNEELDSLSAEPLLLYLLALSGYLEADSSEAAANRNKVYQRLFEDVWARGWGGGRAGPGKQLTRSDFDRLFETMALAAWHGGDERVATYERFERALKVTRAQEIYDLFIEQEGGDMSNLALNFYLKRPEKESRGFEFTHKSFGEYLVARALIRCAGDMALAFERRTDLALGDWLQAVRRGRLTYELLQFLRDEARLLEPNEAIRLRSQMQRMLSQEVATGFPTRSLLVESWRQEEEYQRASEVALLALTNAVLLAIAENNPKAHELMHVDWGGDRLAFGNLLHRVRQTRDARVAALDLFSYFYLREVWLLATDMIECDLSYSNLDGAWLHQAALTSANLRGASLEGAHMSSTLLRGARLAEANLAGADLDGASLQEAVLSGANLRGASLRNANLRGARLKGADLRQARMQGAEIAEADFTGAMIDGATLPGRKSDADRIRRQSTGEAIENDIEKER